MASAKAVNVNQSDTVTEETQLRKRIQNRVYKRASRLRKGETNKSRKRDAQRHYQVSRWRLDEHEKLGTVVSRDLYKVSGASVSTPDMTAQKPPETKDSAVAVRNEHRQSSPELWFPLPVDHLIHLVKYNVFRGLLWNKVLVDTLTVPYSAPGPAVESLICQPSFFRHSSILPKEPQYSGSLAPTTVQMNVNHFSWIDYLPCPTMRENLICQEFSFSHADFVRDLVGNLMNLDIFLKSSLYPFAPDGGNADDTSTTGTGLVLWGEPYLIDSWEITPSFLHKWSWTISNCQELVESTNYWRASRGETPLLLPANSSIHV